MLTNLFGKKSDHPMLDIKSTQALLDDLPKNDVYKLLAEITEWMESVTTYEAFKVDHQLAVLRMLDEAAQPHVRKLAREYFTPHELTKFQENRLWMALDNFSRTAATAYFAIFKRYSADAKGSSTIRVQLPVLLAHTINAYVSQLKYLCARYEALDKTLWENLAQLCQCAELQKLLDTPVSLFPGNTGSTNVKQQIARLLGWYGSGVNAMNPLSIHLAERLITQYCGYINFRTQRDASDFLSFDLNQPAAPKRLGNDTTLSPETRFIGMTQLQPKLEGLIKILEKNVLPDDLNLGGAYEAHIVREVAQSLLNFLKEPPVRQSPRRTVKVNLTVVSGYENTVDHIGAGLNLDAAKPVQWELEDISANGFLTILAPDDFAGLRIGSLLGVQPAGVSNWGAALVRRMSRDDEGRMHIGVEMLANQIACAALMQSDSAGGEYFEEGQLAIWLYPKPGYSSNETHLLMHVDTFSPHRSLQTEIDEKSYLLIPAGLVEKGTDYDLAKFRLIEQERTHAGETY